MPIALRTQAEAIEQFGDDLLKLTRTFCNDFDNATVDRVCEVPNQEHLETIAAAFQALGRTMQDECDAAEEAEDARRANPLEPDFRGMAQ